MTSLLFLLLFFLSLSNAEIFEGIAKQNDRGFAFLAKFCFDVNHDESKSDASVGTIEVVLDAGKPVPNMVILLFDDQQESWPEVYENEALKCTDVWSKAKNYGTAGVESRWRVDDWNDPLSGRVSWSAKSDLTQNIRPRWWYIALSSCENAIGDDIKFEVHTYQKQRDHWNREFGVNEMGLNTLYLVFFFFYVGFIAVHSLGTYRLRNQLEYTHPLVRLFYAVLVLQFLVVISRMFHYGIFASNGIGVPGLNQFAEVAQIFARVGFLVILMLLAKGWTIKNEKLSGRKWIMIFAILFLLSDVAVIFWKYAVENPAATSVPAGLAFMYYLMMTIWFMWCFWFGYVVYHSWKAETNPPKKKLFLLLAVMYFPWFFGLPFLTLLQLALDPWVRDKVTLIFEILISTVGYTFLSFLLWPTRAEEYFAITGPDTMNAGISNYEQL